MGLNDRKLFELLEDFTRTSKGDMVDCYIDHPDSVFRQWNFSILNSFCFAEFLRYYYNVSNNENIENDNWPEEFLPTAWILWTFMLMTSTERLKYHKIPFVLQFHIPREKSIEKNMLITFSSYACLLQMKMNWIMITHLLTLDNWEH